MTGRFGRGRNDRGAVVIVVAVFAIVAMVFLAFVVDLGNQRQEAREVATSTDAAALAAVSTVDWSHSALSDGVAVCAEVASTDPGYATVQDVADDYLQANGREQPEDLGTCNIVKTGGAAGYVTVTASDVVDYSIAPGSGSVDDMSTARTSGAAAGGLRSIAACNKVVSEGIFGDPDAALPGSETSYTEPLPSATVVAGSVKSSTACPTIPKNGKPNSAGAGNFGKVYYPGGSPANGGTGPNCTPNTTCDYAWNGYYGTVDATTGGSTGNDFGPSTGAYQKLLADGQSFWLPVYESFRGNGNSPGSGFDLTHFVEVRLTAFDPSAGPSFTFEILGLVPYSVTGPPSTLSDVSTAAELCAFGEAPAAGDCIG